MGYFWGKFIGFGAPGPKMTAFHNMMLSGHGLPEIPPGGSVERRLKSRMSRRLQFVDCTRYYNQISGICRVQDE